MTRPVIAAQAAREQGIGGDGNGRGRAAMGERAWPAPSGSPAAAAPLPSNCSDRDPRTLSSDTTRGRARTATVIERCFGRLKGFRRIATRYDKLAGNFFSALCLVAIVAYWL
jgi:transposase